MITASFLVGLAACLVLVGLMYGARDAMRERARASMQRELAHVLERPVATDAENASGSFAGMDVKVTAGHDIVAVKVALPPAVLPYQELLDRFGSDALRERMAAQGCKLTAADRAEIAVTREATLADSLATLGKRLELVREVRELRRFAPSVLLERVPRVRSAYEIDQLLDQLSLHFPEAPETREAFEVAAARAGDKKLAQRAHEWLAERLARAAASA